MTNRSIRRRHAQEERSFKKKGAKSPPRSPKRPPEPREKVLVHDTYHHAFWSGPHQKSKFTLDVLRFVPLGAAIYIAILLLVHAPALLKGEVLADYSIYVRLIVLFIALLPPVLCTIYVREAVDDFAIAGHVESLQNLRFVEHVIRRQRTVAAFEALKVVTFLRKPDIVRAAMQLSDQAGKDEREERSWRSIFDVFDENQDGIFDRSELRVLLTKFSTATEGKITEIIELLDDDKSGEISFDEFYAFGRKLERYVRENVDPHELLKEMFEIVDDDRGGLITVHELHQTIREIGQELSIDDVYNLIKDIDDDGNGALDLEEFHLLLHRVGVEFVGKRTAHCSVHGLYLEPQLLVRGLELALNLWELWDNLRVAVLHANLSVRL